VPTTKRQRLWERLWASSILLYTIVATFVVWRTLSKYGVSPIAFFVIDAITSWTYGISTARLLVTIIRKDWKVSRKWAWASAASFVTPQLYILISARHAPKDVYIIVISVIAVLTVFVAGSLLLQIRKTRATI
jgi:hypothetical protein